MTLLTLAPEQVIGELLCVIARRLNAGQSLREVMRVDRRYLTEFILGKEFPPDTKAIVRAALAGTYPTPPASTSELLA